MNIRKFIITGFLFILVSGCAQISPGHVGVKVDLVGNRGISTEEVGVGKYLYNPAVTDYYEFPVFTQVNTLDGEEMISFNSSEGSSFKMPIAIEYNFVPGEIGGENKLFARYRQSSEVIFNQVVRRVIADKFNIIGSLYRADQILGESKNELLFRVTQEVKKEFEGSGINVSRISYAGEAVVPESVKEAINNVLQAKQKAIAAQQKKAEAEAQAAANEALTRSLTPELLQNKAVEKWDGRLPQSVNGAIPFIQIEQKQ